MRRTEPTARRHGLRWLGWFASVNALVLCAVALRYAPTLETGHGVLSWIYLVTSFASHLMMLALIPLLALVGPLVLLRVPGRWLRVGGCSVMALLIALLTLDSLLWDQSRFHLNGLTARILGQVSWFFAASMFAIALLFESMLARALWRWTSAPRSRQGGLMATFWVALLIAAQGMHAWADASYFVPVTSTPINLPLYRGVTAKSAFERLGWVDLDVIRERRYAQRTARGVSEQINGSLDYPLTPMTCENRERLNVLLIVIDSLRADTVDARNTPRIHSLVEQGAFRFASHYSGGNSSRAGMFSLFYALLPGYADPIEALHRSPVMIDVLQQQGYEIGVHSSSSVYHPTALDRTAFANVAPLDNEIGLGEAYHTEQVDLIIDHWENWLSGRDANTPFFDFLYFDSSRRPLPEDNTVTSASGEALEYAEYLAAMQHNDGLVGRALDRLQDAGLDSRTVVLITADHGEQFGEYGEGVIGHGSAFTREQLHVPLVVRWPGLTGRAVEQRTSHYDIAPTLISRLAGCTNPPRDYSAGNDLFDGEDWRWILAGSYYNYALIEPQQVTITLPNGRFEVRDWHNRLVPRPVIDTGVMTEMIESNQRFHR